MSNLAEVVRPTSQYYFVESVSPRYAELLLSKNTINRRVSKTNVDFLAQQMKAGKWMLNGEAIKFAEDGTLIDGQHRLLAVIQCGIPQDFAIIKNVDKGAFATIDTGKNRGASDVLGLDGFSNSSVLGGLIKQKYSFDKYGYFSHALGKIPNTVFLNAANSDERLIESARFSSSAKHKNKLISPAYLAVCHYYLERINPKVFSLFMEMLAEGFGSKGDPALALRKFIVDSRLKNQRMRGADLFPYIVRAFELTIEGRKVQRIRLKDQGEQLEIIKPFRCSPDNY